jgi:hypothetical protein
MSDSIKIAITSNINYFDKCFDRCISSLIEANITPSDIYMFVCGHKEFKKIDNQYGINLYQIDHNSFDFSAFICILELGIQSDYWFLLQDTCHVEKDFYAKIRNFSYQDYDVVAPTNVGTTMNLGLYKHSFLESVRGVLFSLKNKDYSYEALQKFKELSVTYENIFFVPASLDWYLKTHNDVNILISPDDIKIGYFSNKRLIQYNSEVQDYFGNGVKRLKVFFEDISVTKYAANFRPWQEVKEWILTL